MVLAIATFSSNVIGHILLLCGSERREYGHGIENINKRQDQGDECAALDDRLQVIAAALP